MVSGRERSESEVIEAWLEDEVGCDSRGVLCMAVDLMRVMPGRGWTKEESARRMRMSKQKLNELLRSDNPSRRSIERIARGFSVSPSYLCNMIAVIALLRGRCG